MRALKSRNSLPLICIVLTFLFLFTACGEHGTQSNSLFGGDQASYQDPRGLDLDANPDRTYIVGMNPFKESSQFEKAQILAALSEDSVTIENLNDHIVAVEFTPGAKVQASLDKMIRSGNVAFIEPNYTVYPIGMPNDTEISKQWAHSVVKSSAAWDLSLGSDDVIVAVIDTGTDVNHPDLKGNIWINKNEIVGNGRDDDGNGLIDDINGWDFANNDNNPADDVDHGTHVAGTIGAVCNNSMGVCGQAQKLKMMPLKFMGTNGGSVANAIKAIEYAIKMRVKIMSNSWGGTQSSQGLAQVIAKAEQSGIMFIAAAGNDTRNNDQTASYPASYPNGNIISVAATDSSDRLANFSNYGVTSVDIGAPGVNIYSTRPGNRYQFMNGTSMATPLVSGVVALMYGLKPTATVCEIRKALLSSVDSVSSLQGKVATGGRINALKAVEAIKTVQCDTSNPNPNPNPTPTPPPGVARQPTLNGQIQFTTTNINGNVALEYDVSEFASNGAVKAYVEVSKANQEFSNPNGNTPDLNRLTYVLVSVLKGTINFVPSRALPGMGTYAFRVIPLNSQNNAAGKFSNSSYLKLSQ